MSEPARPSAQRIWDRCESLAALSELAGGLTRVYLSDEQRRANELVLGWMREAGMSARLDAAGNCVGRYEGERPGLPALVLGSHLDTVRDAGKYDGMLGVVAGIECVHALHAAGRRLPFATEVIGFADEEGTRFNATLLGSRAVAGTFRTEVLDAVDRGGVSMRDALRRFGLDPERIGEAAKRKEDVLAYAELHIEQGPVLEAEGLPVGVVTAINGAQPLRRRDRRHGRPRRHGADGAPPGRDGGGGGMRARGRAPLRRRARAGRHRRQAGVRCRAPSTWYRARSASRSTSARRATARDSPPPQTSCARCRRSATGAACEVKIAKTHEGKTAPCAGWLQAQIGAAIAAEGLPVRKLPSGAGHDGMAMIELADIGMLFIRCEKGISHNPAEAITLADVETGARVFLRFIERFDPTRRS